VALIDLVVEIVFEDAVGVRRVPFLGNKLHLLQNRLLIYIGVSLAM
jgi:hypothetical protein